MSILIQRMHILHLGLFQMNCMKYLEQSIIDYEAHGRDIW